MTVLLVSSICILSCYRRTNRLLAAVAKLLSVGTRVQWRPRDPHGRKASNPSTAVIFGHLFYQIRLQ